MLLTSFPIDNSRVWGYLPLPTSGGVYEPDSRSPWPPFKVHLVGQGKFDYPNELHNIVVIHGNLVGLSSLPCIVP